MKGARVTGKNQICILVADDHFVVRMGLTAVINAQPDMEVVAEASSGQQAIDLFSRHRPDITLMDIRMPRMNGIEATSAIRRIDPKARIIVLTTYDGDEDIYRALEAGARAYLLKDTLKDELLRAIRNVHAGLKHIPPEVASRLAERMPRSHITQREMEVLELIVKGYGNRDIGTTLSISEGTVKIHVNSLLSKLGVSDRTQAATTALQRGIIHID